MSYVAVVRQPDMTWSGEIGLDSVPIGQTFRAFLIDVRGRRMPVRNGSVTEFVAVRFGTNEFGDRYLQGQASDGQTNIFIYL